MKAIIASKIFASMDMNRQQKIVAKLNNPMNVELVKQLKTYLDEEYQSLADEGHGVSNEGEIEEEHLDTGEDKGAGSSFVSSHPSYSSESSSSLDDFDPTEGGYEEVSEGDSIDGEEEPSDEVEDEEVESSQGFNIMNVVKRIKDSLNSREDTKGVNRILVKDKELWIYYQDKMNLNTVMAEVIEYLNSAGYTYLEFNRLARSENAIVFDLSFIDTNTVVEPMEGDVGEEK